jgi:hypothetical protein
MRMALYRAYDFVFPIWFGISPDPSTMNIFDPPRQLCLFVWPKRLYRNFLIWWLKRRMIRSVQGLH